MIKKILLAVGLIIIVPVLIVVFYPVIIFFEIRSWIALVNFRRRENGAFYLVCSRANGWYDFLKNNVIPVVPPTMKILWLSTERSTTHATAVPPLLEYLAQSRIFGTSKPFLAAVSRQGLRVKSLNQEMLALKKVAKVSEATQTACREILLSAQKELKGV
ncbi:MAG TPA: hypothetical protein VLJ10_01105 [Candidatus Bathyarchaeia archaeon]|nr:hypothetical protein [Candidatus Bathyarchaeia archaeon]